MEKEESRRLAGVVVNALLDKLAENVRVVEIDEISPLADYFVMASGRNLNHTDALRDSVEENASKAGFEPDHIEGHRNANWKPGNSMTSTASGRTAKRSRWKNCNSHFR